MLLFLFLARVYSFGVVFVPLVVVFCTVSFAGSGSRNFAITGKWSDGYFPFLFVVSVFTARVLIPSLTGMWSILGPDVLPEKPCRVPVGSRLGFRDCHASVIFG